MKRTNLFDPHIFGNTPCMCASLSVLQACLCILELGLGLHGGSSGLSNFDDDDDDDNDDVQYKKAYQATIACAPQF